MGALPEQVLNDIIEKVMEDLEEDQIGTASTFVLLPKALEFITKSENIELTDDDETKKVSSSAYKDKTIANMCSSKWPTSAIPPFIETIRDVPLTEMHVKTIADKVDKELSKVALQDLTALFYQFILLSIQGQRATILKVIFNHIRDLDEQAHESEDEAKKKMLVQMEGTLILQINFAMKQDQILGTEFLKIAKVEIWTPFIVGILLSLGTIQRFEEKAYSLLKTSILAGFKTSIKSQNPSLVGTAGNLQSQQTQVLSLVLMNVVIASGNGWDNITQSLCAIGFLLMDTPIVKSDGSTQRAVQLGQQVLREIFKLHQIVRSELIEQLLARIVRNSAENSFFIELLTEIIADAPQLLLDSMPKIKEALDYLSFIPQTTAEGLLAAVQPLVYINPSFQDHLILVLRKTVFSREDGARMTAVAGFLLLLGSLKHFEPQAAEKLGAEILGFLKRCLSQGPAVREKLYSGLPSILAGNSGLQEYVFDLLLGQFLKYYDKNAAAGGSPFDFSKCIEPGATIARVSEPIAKLVQSVHLCLVATKDPEDLSASQVEATSRIVLQRYMEEICERILKCDLEDFELGGDATIFSPDTPEGSHNLEIAILVASVYEVLLDFQVENMEISIEQLQNVLKLFEHQNRIRKAIFEKKSAGKKGDKDEGSPKPKKGKRKKDQDENPDEDEEGGKKKAGKKAAPKKKREIPVYIGLTSLNKLVQVYVKDLDELAEIRTSWRSHDDFSNYLFSTVKTRLSEILQAESEGKKAILREKNFCTRISPLLFAEYKEIYNNGVEEERMVQRKCLESLEISLKFLATTLNPQKELMDLFCRIQNVKPNNSSFDTVLSHAASEFEEFAMITVGTAQYSEAENCLNIVKIIVSQLPESEMELHKEWLEKICKEHVAVASFAKSLLKTYLSMPGVSVRPLIKSIKSQLGPSRDDENWDSAADDPDRLKMVNEHTVAHMIPIILESRDSIVRDAELSLKMTNNSMADDELNTQATVRNELREQIHQRLHDVSGSYYFLADCAISGTPADLFVKALTRFYKVMGNVTKDLMNDKDVKEMDPPKQYLLLVERISRSLNPMIVRYIGYVESKQTKIGLKKSAKTVPNLIYAMEKFEGMLIKYSKKVPPGVIFLELSLNFKLNFQLES
eukprot:TRINITY_DN9993_c1_g1_i2.p1 TRINITY_DN9993_c1_g1~~TRINITY_DN9993_c1_g1_i2.p1  ORF type:complete len:1240 (-),score=447.43 TRINITY_DN9993_c1_g1_i2:248-3661(-)